MIGVLWLPYSSVVGGVVVKLGRSRFKYPICVPTLERRSESTSKILATIHRRHRRCGCEVGEEPFKVSDMRSNAGASERVKRSHS